MASRHVALIGATHLVPFMVPILEPHCDKISIFCFGAPYEEVIPLKYDGVEILIYNNVRIDDTESISTHFQGVDSLFLSFEQSLPFNINHYYVIINIGIQKNITNLTFLSRFAFTEIEACKHSEYVKRYNLLENYIQDRQWYLYTCFYTSFSFEELKRWNTGVNIEKENLVEFPFPPSANISLLSEKDISKSLCMSLLYPMEHDGHTYILTGKQEVSMEYCVAFIEKRCTGRFTYKQTNSVEKWSSLAYSSDWSSCLRDACDMYDGSMITDDVESITGDPPVSFENFCFSLFPDSGYLQKESLPVTTFKQVITNLTKEICASIGLDNQQLCDTAWLDIEQFEDVPGESTSSPSYQRSNSTGKKIQRDKNVSSTTPKLIKRSSSPTVYHHSPITSPIRTQEDTKFLPKVRPIWAKDSENKACMKCGTKFSVTRRRHHCRGCGQIIDANCCGPNIPILNFGYYKPVRVCKDCHTFYAGES